MFCLHLQEDRRLGLIPFYVSDPSLLQLAKCLLIAKEEVKSSLRIILSLCIEYVFIILLLSITRTLLCV